MKASFLPHLLLLLFPAVLLGDKSVCPVDEAINQKLQEATTSLIHQAAGKQRLECNTVLSSGPKATCPEGFAVTACTCGKGCGSWDVRGGTTCHCQCKDMDWTGARCCQ